MSNNSNEINVKITGKAGVGKSTITQIIHEALSLKGINCDINSIMNEHSLRTKEQLNRCINSISAKSTKVTINEIH